MAQTGIKSSLLQKNFGQGGWRRCELTSQFAIEDHKDNIEKIEALKEVLLIHNGNSEFDKEIWNLLSEDDLEGLKRSMGVVWDRQAKIHENMSFIEETAPAKQQKYINKMKEIGRELKKSIHECMQEIELHKKKLIVIYELSKKRQQRLNSGACLEDRSFRDAIYSILEEKGGGVRLDDASKDPLKDSAYLSFEEDPEELKHVQKTFFNKPVEQIKGDEGVIGTHDNANDLTIIKMISDDVDIADPTIENIPETRKKTDKSLCNNPKQYLHDDLCLNDNTVKEIDPQMSKFSYDKIPFESIINLISKNPAFVKYPVSDDAQRREKMPVFRDPHKTINVWSLLKHNIGKDFARITLPVYVNEPYSMLHRVAENVQYHECFRTANRTEDPYLRISHVLAGFFILFGHTTNRLKKPFNPLLGETFEYIDGDLRLLVEQMSHHPPICSFHADSDDFILEGFFSIIIKFGYKGFQITPTGDLKLYLKRPKEQYSITRPLSTLHNYIMGKMYLWHSGELIVKNETTGDTAIMYLKPKSWTSKSDYEAEGKVIDKFGQTYYSLYGRWDSFATAIDIKTQKEITLITRKAEVPDYEQQYYFSKFSIGLNHLTKSMLMKLPQTDTRFRPDQRAYEYGDVTIAAEEKHRLEEAQRHRRKICEGFKPLWFDIQVENNAIVGSRYKGGYWEARDSGHWPVEMPNLFNV